MNKIDDAEIIAFIDKTESFYPADANLASPEKNRQFYDAMCAAFRQQRPQTITVEDKQIAHVPIRIYRPNVMSYQTLTPPTAILYAHGGGYVVGSLDSHDDICAEIAANCGLIVTALDYRLAPESPFPAQLDDMEIVFDKLAEQNTRLIIMGDSAGGHLCAALSLRLRHWRKTMPLAQILIYPGLGGDLSLPSYSENAEAPLLRTKDLLAYRTAANTQMLDDITVQESAPLQAQDFANLPPSWVFTADIDPLRDDGKHYVECLTNAGIQASWRNDAQLVHGYLRGRFMSKRIAAAFQAICASIKDAACLESAN